MQFFFSFCRETFGKLIGTWRFFQHKESLFEATNLRFLAIATSSGHPLHSCSRSPRSIRSPESKARFIQEPFPARRGALEMDCMLQPVLQILRKPHEHVPYLPTPCERISAVCSCLLRCSHSKVALSHLPHWLEGQSELSCFARHCGSWQKEMRNLTYTLSWMLPYATHAVILPGFRPRHDAMQHSQHWTHE